MLSNDQIAVLCDIGQSTAFAEDKKRRVDQLVAEGYAEKTGELYKLTPKGEQAVTERGAGLNES